MVTCLADQWWEGNMESGLKGPFLMTSVLRCISSPSSAFVYFCNHRCTESCKDALAGVLPIGDDICIVYTSFQTRFIVILVCRGVRAKDLGLLTRGLGL